MNENIKLLKWFNFFLDFAPYSAFLILYFAQISGSFALALGIFSIHSISTCIFEVPTGVFSDRIGRKKTLALGALANIAAISLYATGGSFWVLGLGAVFAGLSESFFSGNNDALLYETLKQSGKESKYAEVSGKVASMFQVGLALSALLGGWLSTWSLELIMWVSVIPQVVCFFISLKIKEPKVHSHKIESNMFGHLKEAFIAFRKSYKLKTLSLTHILDFGIGECMHQFNPTFIAMLWPSWAIGIMRFLSNTLAFVGFHFAGRFINKFSELKVLLTSAVTSRILKIIALLFPTVFSPLLFVATDVGFGATTVSKGALMQKEFTNEQRATMASLNSFLGNVGFAIFAIGIGILADKTSPQIALLIGELVLISNVGLYWSLFKQVKQR